MSNSRFILQGITQNDDHIQAVSHVFSLHPFGKGLVATAFMNAAGASMLVKMLGENSKACRVFVGIRNGVTTIQALRLLLESGIHPIVVDTASQAYIFHPKVYLASNNSIARLIIGSANITLGGLAKNVEASIFSEYPMDENAAFIESIYDKFEVLSANCPENVFRINTPEALEKICQESLLVDETRTTWHSNTKSIEGVRAESRQRMRLNTRHVSSTMSARHSGSHTESIENSGVDIKIVENQNLLWKSKALTRRDLNIPEGVRTNRTGSMLLKKGDPTQLIDQRIYFRLIVFGSADWKADPREGSIPYFV